MAGVKRAPSKEQLRKYLDRKLTQQEMADAYFEETGIRLSRSAIAMTLHRSNMSERPAQRHMDLLPWTLRPEHRYHRDARYLRLESRRRRGDDLGDAELRRLNTWMTELDTRNSVVYYDPDSPGGWWWIERTADDVDVIRRPEALIPSDWEVLPEHQDHPDYRVLQLEVRRRRGEDLWGEELAVLNDGIDDLEAKQQVISYTREDGWVRLPMSDADRDYTRRYAVEPAYYCPQCKVKREPDEDQRCTHCGELLSRILGKA